MGMRLIISLLAFHFIIMLEASAQRSNLPSYFKNQPIEIGGVFNNTYKIQGVKLKPADIRSLLGNETALASEFNRGQTLSSTAMVLGVAGGFCVGYPLGKFIGNSQSVTQTDWTVLGIGCGVVGLSAILDFLGSGAKRKAVIRYNNSLSQTGHLPTKEIRIGFAASGAGIALHF